LLFLIVLLKKLFLGFKEAVFELVRLAACELPADVEKALSDARSAEEPGSSAELTLSLFLKNIAMAKEKQAPVCQDTGLPIFFISHPEGVSQRQLIRVCQEAASWATAKPYLRHNAVDAVTGKNSGNNIGLGFPAVYFTEWDDPAIEMALILKGGGSENMSRLFMLKPADGLAGIRERVVLTVAEAGPNPCPPIIVGVGIGGNFERAALLAKKSLLRELGQANPDPEVAAIERQLLAEVNDLGIGPAGLGGRITAMAVQVLMQPCHIASLPLAVNIQCHASRHKEVVL